MTVARPLGGDLGSPTSDPTLQNDALLTVTVLAYDYADVPRDILTAAEDEASRVYREIGIDLAWLHVDPAALGKRGMLPVTPATPSSMMVMIIASRVMRELDDQSHDVLGIAPRSPGEDSAIAYAFYPRIETIANGYHASVGSILGQVFAHELGHLLLPVNAHEVDGIMRGSWDSAHARQAVAGDLHFTAEQADHIRAKVGASLP